MSKVLDYLNKHKFTIHTDGTTNKIVIHFDDSCAMAYVELNDMGIMMGNHWDFHPGCHGIGFNFRGPQDLADKVERAIRRAGYEVAILHNMQWSYEEDA